MKLSELKNYIDQMIANGEQDLPVYFRNCEGKFESIDYCVTSNDGTKLTFAEEWM